MKKPFKPLTAAFDAPDGPKVSTPPLSASKASLDEQIRAFGYSIHSRPLNREPSWAKSGIIFDQSDICRRHDLSSVFISPPVENHTADYLSYTAPIKINYN